MKQLRLLPAPQREAVFNATRTHRYSLFIKWAEGKLLNGLFLNCSTADEHVNDPTIERTQRRAQKLGFGSLAVTNLFAFRSTDPRALKTCDDPVGGPENDEWIMHWALKADMVLCGWGIHGAEFDRSNRVRKMLAEKCVRPHCLGTCENGEPRHPLYVGYAVQPVPYDLEVI